MGSSLGSIGEVVSTAMDPLDVLGFRASARATEDAANSQLKQQFADRNEAQKYAEPTPAELANMQNAIRFSEADIARKEKLLASADPALIEAGRNALKLLQGQEASVLGPLKTNIAKQESTLRARLAAQLGPGYENTTAGIQALQAFNEQANGALANAQQNSLGQLLGVTQNVANQNSNINTQMNLGQLLGNIQGRQINTLQGFGVNPSLAYAGAQARANIVPNMINTGAQIVGTLSGMGSLGSQLGFGSTGMNAAQTANMGSLNATSTAPINLPAYNYQGSVA